jgi:hypothetical protein
MELVYDFDASFEAGQQTQRVWRGWGLNVLSREASEHEHFLPLTLCRATKSDTNTVRLQSFSSFAPSHRIFASSCLVYQHFRSSSSTSLRWLCARKYSSQHRWQLPASTLVHATMWILLDLCAGPLRISWQRGKIRQRPVVPLSRSLKTPRLEVSR